jgi:hypothetical protein
MVGNSRVTEVCIMELSDFAVANRFDLLAYVENDDPNVPAGWACLQLFVPEQANIPTLTQWGMTAMVLLVVTGGLLLIWRRRRSGAPTASA